MILVLFWENVLSVTSYWITWKQCSKKPFFFSIRAWLQFSLLTRCAKNLSNLNMEGVGLPVPRISAKLYKMKLSNIGWMIGWATIDLMIKSTKKKTWFKHWKDELWHICNEWTYHSLLTIMKQANHVMKDCPNGLALALVNFPSKRAISLSVWFYHEKEHKNWYSKINL